MSLKFKAADLQMGIGGRMGGVGVDGQSGAPEMLTLPPEQRKRKRKRKIVGKVGLGAWGCYLTGKLWSDWIPPANCTAVKETPAS